MAVTTDQLVVEVSVELGKVKSSVDKTVDQLEKLSSSAERTGKNIDGAAKVINSSFSKIGAGIVVANQAFELFSRSIAQVQGAFRSTLGAAAGLEKRVAEINTLITDGTAGQVDFAQSILEVQRQFGGGQGDIAKAFYDALSSGAVGASNATDLLSATNKLAVGGVTDVGTATGLTTGLLNAFQLGVEDVTKVTDTLFTTVQKGVTTIPELSEQFGIVAATAGPAGVSLEEVGAAFATVTASGVSTARAATSIRAAIIALQKPSDALKETFAELGIESVDTALKQEGLGSVLQRVSNSVGNSADAVVNLIGNVEALPAVVNLAIQNSEKFAENLDAVRDAAESGGEVTQVAFQKIAQTSAAQFNRAQANITASLTDLGIAFKTVFAGALDNAAQGILDLSQTIVEFARGLESFDFDDLTTKVQNFTIAVAASITVLKSGAILAFAQTTLPLIAAGFVKAGVAVRGFIVAFGPITIAVTALTTALDLIIANFNQLDVVATTVLDGLAALFTRVAQKALEGFEFLFSAVGLDGVASKFADNADALSVKADEFSRSFQGAGKKLKSSFTKDLLVATGILDNVQKSVEDAAKGTSEASAQIADTTAQVAQVSAQEIVKLTEEQEAALDTLAKAIKKAKDQQFEISLLDKSDLEVVDARLMKQMEQVDALRDTLQTQGVLNSETQKQLDLLNQVAEAQAQADRIKIDFIDPEQASLIAQIEDANAAFAQEQQRRSQSQLQFIESQKNAELEKLDVLEEQLKVQLALAEAANDQADAARLQAGIAQVQQGKSIIQGTASLASGDVASSALGQGLGGLGIDIGGEISSVLTQALGTELTAAIAEFANVAALVLKAPDLINALTGFIDQITDFPTLLAEAVAGLGDALLRFIETFPENIANGLRSIIDSLITIFVDFIPQLPGVILDAAFELVNVLLERAPDIALAFVEQQLLQGPKIAIGILRALIKGIPLLIKGLINAVPAIVEALTVGLLEAFKELGQEFLSLFSGGDPLGDVDEVADNLGKSLKSVFTGVGDQTFAVLEDVAGGRAEEQFAQLQNALSQGTQRSINFFQRFWNGLKRFFQDPIQFILDEVLNPLGNIVATAWGWVDENILDPLAGVVSCAWAWVDEYIVGPLAGVVSAVVARVHSLFL